MTKLNKPIKGFFCRDLSQNCSLFFGKLYLEIDKCKKYLQTVNK